MIERPEVVDWLAAIHHDDQCSFPTNEVDQELKKSIYRESLRRLVIELVDWLVYYLVNIPNWINPHGNLQ